jgi:hypothetical protein
MTGPRTKKKWPGRNKSSRSRNSLRSDLALDHAVVLLDTVCCLAGDEQLIGNQSNPEITRLRRAIVDNDTPSLFEVLMEAFSFQGISDHAAFTYMERHGRLTWRDLERATARAPSCSKLRCYWMLSGCGYRKEAQTCAMPQILADATVPQIATFTGHSLRDVEAILDAHYLGRDVQLAELAVMKLEARTKL